MLMAFGTNVKINIFGTVPVTRENLKRIKYFQHVFKHDGIYKKYLTFSKIKTVGARSYIFNKNPSMLITMHGFKF